MRARSALQCDGNSLEFDELSENQRFVPLLFVYSLYTFVVQMV